MKKCRICGVNDARTFITLKGYPEVCGECAQKYVELNAGNISLDDIITPYTDIILAKTLGEAVGSANEKVLAEMQEQRKQEEEKRNAKEAEKAKACAEMLISSGFSFEGYAIRKYSGYISGDDCITVPRANFFGNSVESNLCGALNKIRIQALKELKEAAYELGCNAVVGVDFDYIVMDPQHASIMGNATVYEPYVICVTANGNAVIIEKNQ